MMITNQACNPARVALLDYIGIVYSFGIDIFLFELNFSMIQIVGVAVILALNILVMFKSNTL